MTTPPATATTTAAAPHPPDDEIALLRAAAITIRSSEPRIADDLARMADAAEPLEPGADSPPGYPVAVVTAGHILSGTWPLHTADTARGIDYTDWPTSRALLVNTVLAEHDGTPVTPRREARLLRMRAAVARAAATEHPEHAARYRLHADQLAAHADHLDQPTTTRRI